MSLNAITIAMNLRRASPAVSLVKVSFQRRFVRIDKPRSGLPLFSVPVAH